MNLKLYMIRFFLGVDYRSLLDIQPCRGVYLSAKIAIYSGLQDELITFNLVFLEKTAAVCRQIISVPTGLP
jgi:hypothetical protein